MAETKINLLGDISNPPFSTQTQPSRAFITVYQNTTGKPMLVCASVSLSSGDIQCISDSNSSPTTVVSKNGIGGGQVHTFVVLPNNYYKIIHGGSASIIMWTEWY